MVHSPEGNTTAEKLHTQGSSFVKLCFYPLSTEGVNSDDGGNYDNKAYTVPGTLPAFHRN